MPKQSTVAIAAHAHAESIRAAATAIFSAPHGSKDAVAREWCERLGMSKPTLYAHIEKAGIKPMHKTRKRRADAGEVSLDAGEAAKIAEVIKQTTRANGKRTLSTEDTVAVLRANGAIRAERIDEETGEVKQLSISAINRALRVHGMHSEQLAAPAPHTELASLHPNHVWEIDFSVCVLFYLPVGAGRLGLRVMDEKQFNKNKPGNIAKIERDRVQRILIVDHTTSAFYLSYVHGAESAMSAIDAFN